jgi:ABC-type antimicrobial peptide transport system permease subunit
MVLVAIIASLALALAAAGLYGVLAYVVSRRNGEIGIRMALGAQRADVMRMVIGRGLRLACAGVAAGLLISLAAARVMSSLLFDTKSTDAGMLAAGPVVLLAVAALACYIPARRASRVDPMVALRME